MHQRDGKVKCLLAKAAEDVGTEFFAEERSDDGFGEVSVSVGLMGSDKAHWNLRNHRRGPEATLARHRSQEHLTQAGSLRGVGGRDELELTSGREHGRPED